jgi:hypothetical protein
VRSLNVLGVHLVRPTFFRFALACLVALPAPGRRFYADDPLHREPKPRDASKAIRRKISDYYDFLQQTFAPSGDRQPKTGPPIAGSGVNTLGEPLDGAWYVKRHYYYPMSTDDLVRGPGNTSGPSTEGRWTVVKAKSEGVTPGFEFIDSKKRRYVLKFDPLEFPEIATAPDVLVSKFFHALGYHVPENYIVSFAREELVLGEDVTLTDNKGKVRKMTERDVTELLLRVPRDSQGRYRGGASLFLQGKPLGPYKYQGLRRDDPNDIVPHEHRRELRGLSVFCAWVAHDDSRAINSLDMLVQDGGVPHIRHHLIDFGSTLGSASYGPNSPRSGFEYVFGWSPAVKQFLTLGLAVPDWAKAKYPGLRSVGVFEAEKFDAERWVAEYPNPAFSNRLPDDAFWAAKQVMAFTDEHIRAIVQTGQYSNQKAEDWITRCLITRRDKIGKAFFARVLPLDRFDIREGRLVFEDVAAKHGFQPARSYTYRWSEFDNESARKTPVPGATSAAVPASQAEYLACDLQADDPKKTITVYVRRRAAVVGIDRTW